MINARLDLETERMLRRLERRFGWSASQVVREGIKVLNGLTQRTAARCGIGSLFIRHPRPRLQQDPPEGIRPLTPELVDNGSIIALLDRSERHHKECAAVVAEIEAPLLTCEAVIAEACYHSARPPPLSRRQF
jgi:hypothetical protein